jgi:putative hydrolase of the HAD superfamily
VVFYEERSFSADDFKSFMFSRSQPYEEMLALVRSIKAHNPLKIITVSNEGREVNDYRIRKFKLEQLIDTFISSCFVHYRKPDTDIYRIALDVSQTTPDEVAYIEDRPLFVEVANSLGIHGIQHIDAPTTAAELAKLGIVSQQS